VLKQGASFAQHQRSTGPLWPMLASALILIIGITILHASPPKGDQDNSQQNQNPKASRDAKRRRKAIQREMVGPYGMWLREEVPYIITDRERAAFKMLTTDDEREAFIENFWERRNPNPGSPENEYKEEYYQGIICANERYGTAIPGWKTDRGRLLIMYGPPEHIDSHPDGEACGRQDSQGTGTPTCPFEEWRYRCLPGIGENIVLKFVDTDRDGEYHLAVDPDFKNASLLYGAGSWSKTDWFAPLKDVRSYWEHLELGSFLLNRGFTRLDLYAGTFQPPLEKFSDLKAFVTAKVPARDLPFDLRMDFIRVTGETVLVPITMQVAVTDLQFQTNDKVMHGSVDIYGEIATLGGRIVKSFARNLVINVPEDLFREYQLKTPTFQEAPLLKPGHYKLSLVLKDELSGHLGSKQLSILVPRFSEDQLTSSSLILAYPLQPLPSTQMGAFLSPFTIGVTSVRPNVNNILKRGYPLQLYIQVYNLGLDEKTHRPSLDVRYQVEKDGKVLLDQPEWSATLAKASQQFTVVKSTLLQGFAPGTYTARITITDNVRKQTVSPSVAFELR
jgi:GWxTD domain-containing protein